MAGTFQVGEVKVRPGAYSNIQKVSEGVMGDASDGVVAVLFKSDFGPLNQAVELSVHKGYESTYGTELTTDAIEQAFTGGAQKVVCCRIGEGGTEGSVVLKNDQDADAVKINAKYVGAKPFCIAVRDMLSNEAKKECIIYDGTKEFEKVEFEKEGDQAANLVEALKTSRNFIAEKMGTADEVLADISQEDFTVGTNPTVTVDSYSTGLQAIEANDWLVVCVDTEDAAVHKLVQSYLDRIFEVGQMAMAVIAEKQSVSFDARLDNAAAFNDEKIIYLLNGSMGTTAGDIDGYQAAARIAGMVAACPSSKSLTHTVINGVTELYEKLTPTQIINAELSGCLVLSTSPSSQVWIDSAINTLVTPGDKKDEGWKKIRRTKTRYELIKRVVAQADLLVGEVDNDVNGRATIVSQLQGIGNAMISEGKLVACTISESEENPAQGDSCWFDIDAIDKDSAEHVYLTFKFRFNTQE